MEIHLFIFCQVEQKEKVQNVAEVTKKTQGFNGKKKRHLCKIKFCEGFVNILIFFVINVMYSHKNLL